MTAVRNETLTPYQKRYDLCKRMKNKGNQQISGIPQLSA
jgi:hypothetical protein